MTRHEIKREVGVRELHNQLSRYVRHVGEGGGEVAVTLRGRHVARLVPIEADDALADLRRRGIVREPARPKPRARGGRRASPRGSVSDLVSKQRR